MVASSFPKLLTAFSIGNLPLPLKIVLVGHAHACEKCHLKAAGILIIHIPI